MNSPDQTNQPTAPKLNQRQRLLAEQLAAGVPREKAARAAGYTMGAKSADAAISNAFGPNVLKSFKVWTDEIGD